MGSHFLFGRGFLILVFLIPAVSYADTIILRSGQQITGQIINQNTTSITIRTDNGIRTIPKGQVGRIIYSDSPNAQAEKEAEQRRLDAKRKELEKDREAARQAQEARDRQDAEERQRKLIQEQEANYKKASEPAGRWYLPDLRSFRGNGWLWDPDRTETRLTTGLSVGTARNDWFAYEQAKLFDQLGRLKTGQLYLSEPLEYSEGNNESGYLEFRFNRYIGELSFRRSTEAGAAKTLESGPDDTFFFNTMPIDRGDLAGLGESDFNKARWEDWQLILGYDFFHNGSSNLSLLTGWRKSNNYGEISEARITNYSADSDVTITSKRVLADANYDGPLLGIAGQFQPNYEFASDSIRAFLPSLDARLTYQTLDGRSSLAMLRTTVSQVYDVSTKYEAFTGEVSGYALAGELRLLFGLGDGLTLYIAGYGNSTRFRYKHLNVTVKEPDPNEVIQSIVYGKVLAPLFNGRDVQRGSSLGMQWSRTI